MNHPLRSSLSMAPFRVPTTCMGLRMTVRTFGLLMRKTDIALFQQPAAPEGRVFRGQIVTPPFVRLSGPERAEREPDLL